MLSVLGPSNMGPIHLASSAAGSLRNAADTDQVQAEKADRKVEADQVQLSSRGLDDSLESDLSHGQVSDRDPDGRQAWAFQGGAGQSKEENRDDTTAKTPADPTGERGQSLDLSG